jgi:hypothetical protein
MLRSTTLARATEFADQKAKRPTHRVWSKYGMGYLFTNRVRRMWTRAVRVRTTDKNRISNFSQTNTLVSRAISQIDEEKTKEVNPNFDINDMRVDDFRRVGFKCPCCGQSYIRTLKGRLHHLKGCPQGCDREDVDPNVVSAFVQKSAKNSSSSYSKLKDARGGDVLKRLVLFSDKGSKELLGEIPTTSTNVYKFKCCDCGEKTFENTVRAVAGNTTNIYGLPHLTVEPNSFENELANRCAECQHKYAMKYAFKKMGNDESCKKGFYGGLNF